MRMMMFPIVGVAAAGALALGDLARADVDEAQANFVIITDSAERFFALGEFSTIDKRQGGPFAINGPPVTVAGDHWRFVIRHIVKKWVGAGGDLTAKKVQIQIDEGINDPPILAGSIHLTAPHTGEQPNNLLDEVKSKRVDIKITEREDITAYKRKKHGKDYDHYAVNAKIQPFITGGDNALGGFTKIGAKHTGKRKISIPELFTVGSTNGGVSYNAETGLLTFDIGAIDILDSVGGQTGAIDPMYAKDAILNAEFEVDPFQFFGQTPDTRYLFKRPEELSGPNVRLFDLQDNFRFDAKINKYFIDDTSGEVTDPELVLSSFGLFDSISSSRVDDEFGTGSDFLADFVDRNIFGEGLSSEEWLLLLGNDFTFLTAPGRNLADLTEGFTTSIFDEPATFLITGNAMPGPGALPLLALTGLVARRRRRR